MANTLNIKVGATLDHDKSVRQINSAINKVAKQINKDIKIRVSLDDVSMKQVEKKITSIMSKMSNATAKATKQTNDQSVGVKEMAQNLDKATSKATKLAKSGKEISRVFKDANGAVYKMQKTIESTNGATVKSEQFTVDGSGEVTSSLTKTFDPSKIDKIRKTIRELKKEIKEAQEKFGELGSSKKLQPLVDTLDKLSKNTGYNMSRNFVAISDAVEKVENQFYGLEKKLSNEQVAENFKTKLTTSLNEVYQKVYALKGSFNGLADNAQLNAFVKQLLNVEQSLDNEKADFEALRKEISYVENAVKSYKTQLSKEDSQNKQAEKFRQAYTYSAEAINKKLQEVKATFGSLASGAEFNSFKNKLALLRVEIGKQDADWLKVKEIIRSINEDLRKYNSSLKTQVSAKTQADNMRSDYSYAFDVLEKRFSKIKGNFKNILDPAVVSKFEGQMDELANEILKEDADWKKVKRTLNEINSELSEYNSKLGKQQSKQTRDNDLAKAYNFSVGLIEKKINSLKEKFGNLFSDDDVNNLKNRLSQLSKLINSQEVDWVEVRNVIKGINTDLSEYKSKLSKQQKTDNQAEAFRTNYTSSINDVYQKLIALKAEFGSLVSDGKIKVFKTQLADVEDELVKENADFVLIGKAIAKIISEINTYKNSLKGVRSEQQKLNAETKTLQTAIAKNAETLKNTTYSLNYLMSAQMALSYTRRFAKEVLSEIKDVDTAMVELKRVTSLTENQYDKFLSTAAEQGEALGVSMTDYINAVTTFARGGFGVDKDGNYNFAEVEKLAKTASILKAVSEDLTADEASQYLVAAIRAYGIEADNAISIVDKLDNVANKESVTIGGLGVAIEKAGASLSAANNTVEESIALITAANSVVQNPANVGVAFKTISMRMRGMKLNDSDELEDGESEYSLSLVPSKIQASLDVINKRTGENIQLFDEQNKRFYSTYEVLSKLATIWNKVDDSIGEYVTAEEKSALAEAIAGKTRANVLQALLNNSQILEKSYKEAMDSEGAAVTEHEKRLKSIEAHVNQLKAAWQNFATSATTVEAINKTLDTVRTLLDLLTNSPIGSGGALLTAAGGMFGLGFASNSSGKVNQYYKDMLRMQALQGQMGEEMKILAKDSNIAMETLTSGLSKSVIQAGKTKAAIAILGNTLRTAFTGIFVGAAVGLAIAGALKVFGLISDKINDIKHKIDNLESNVETRQQELNDLENQRSSLLANGDLTAGQKKQLESLEYQIKLKEKQLDLDKQIYKQELLNDTASAVNKDRPSDVIGFQSDFKTTMDNVDKLTEKYKKSTEEEKKLAESIETWNQMAEESADGLIEKYQKWYAEGAGDNQIPQYNYQVEQTKKIEEDLGKELDNMIARRKELLAIMDELSGEQKEQADASLTQLNAAILETSQLLGLEDTLDNVTGGYRLAEVAILELEAGHELSEDAVSRLKEAFDLETISVDTLKEATKKCFSGSTEDQIKYTKNSIEATKQRIEGYKDEVLAILDILYANQSLARTRMADIDLNGEGYWDDVNGQYVGKENENYKKLLEYQKLITDQTKDLEKLQAHLDELGKGINTDPTDSGDKDKSDKIQKQIELWDEYGEKLRRINENLAMFDDLISDTNDKISLNESLMQSEGLRSVELYEEQVKLYDQLIEQTYAKQQAEEEQIKTIESQNEMLKEQIQKKADEAGVKIGIDWYDEDLDKFVNEFKNAFSTYTDNGEQETNVMVDDVQNLVNAFKANRDAIKETDNIVLQLEKDMVDATSKRYQINIQFQDDLLDNFEQGRSLSEAIYNALSDVVGVEHIRADIGKSLIETYKQENIALQAMYDENLRRIEAERIAHGENSNEYLSALEAYGKKNNELHIRAINNLREEHEYRKRILAEQLEADKRAAEESVYGGTQSSYERQANKQKKEIQKQIDALKKQEEEEQKAEEEKRLREDLEKKESELAELQQKLINLQNNKNVQQLTQQEDGSWQWEYVADQREIDKTITDINQKKIDVKEAQDAIEKKNDKNSTEALIEALQAQIDAIEEDVSNRRDLYEEETESLQERFETENKLEDERFAREVEFTNKTYAEQQKQLSQYKQTSEEMKKALELSYEAQKGLLNSIESSWVGTAQSITDSVEMMETRAWRAYYSLLEALRAAENASSGGGGGTSAAVGYKFVEKNNMPFRLHYGERVLTRQEAEQYNRLEDDIKSGAFEDALRSAKEDSLNTMSDSYMPNLTNLSSVPIQSNNGTSFVIQNLELPNVQNPSDFASEIASWANNEFSNLKQMATVRKAK